jgi:hypothetical protein
MNDDDLWNLILGNDSNGPSITPFANNLGQGGAGPGSPPPNSGSILDSWKSTGLGGDTLAMLLPQLDDASTTPLPAGPVYFGQSPPSLASTPTGNAPLSSLFSTGLGGDVIASMLPQRQDTGAALPSADARRFSRRRCRDHRRCLPQAPRTIRHRSIRIRTPRK